MKTAYATIRGLEVMNALCKGRAKLWMLSAGIQGEVRLVKRAFGRGRSLLRAHRTFAGFADQYYAHSFLL